MDSPPQDSQTPQSLLACVRPVSARVPPNPISEDGITLGGDPLAKVYKALKSRPSPPPPGRAGAPGVLRTRPTPLPGDRCAEPFAPSRGRDPSPGRTLPCPRRRPPEAAPSAPPSPASPARPPPHPPPPPPGEACPSPPAVARRGPVAVPKMAAARAAPAAG